MWPILYEFKGAGIAVQSHAAMLGIAILLGNVFAPVAAWKLEGIPPRRLFLAQFLLGVAALLGARLHFVMAHPSWFAQFPHDIFQLRTGYHAMGALAAVAIALPLVAKLLEVPARKWADVVVLISGVLFAIGRVGCFMNGCCFGTICTFPWCVTYPWGSAAFITHHELGLIDTSALRSAPVHPIALYFALAGLGIAALGYALYKRKQYDGQVALFGVVAYCVLTFLIELFRQSGILDPRWLGLDHRAWLALGATAVLLTLAALSQAVARGKWSVGS